MVPRPTLSASLVVALATSITALALAGCQSGAPDQRRLIRTEHMPRLAKAWRDDLRRHLVGVEKAATRMAPGFGVDDPLLRERQMRAALGILRQPRRGVPDLLGSPSSFMAAVGPDGVVVARDAEPDQMKGLNLAQRFAVVRAALAGRTGYELGEFASLERGGEPSVTVLFAAPARRNGAIVGAVVIGMPLWRIAQRFTKQLQVDTAGQPGTIVWAYVYRGAKLHHFGTSPEVDEIVPSAQARQAGLAQSPGGYTSEHLMRDVWYGIGVMPLPSIGPDVGVVVMRAHAQ